MVHRIIHLLFGHQRLPQQPTQWWLRPKVANYFLAEGCHEASSVSSGYYLMNYTKTQTLGSSYQQTMLRYINAIELRDLSQTPPLTSKWRQSASGEFQVNHTLVDKAAIVSILWYVSWANSGKRIVLSKARARWHFVSSTLLWPTYANIMFSISMGISHSPIINDTITKHHHASLPSGIKSRLQKSTMFGVHE